jgi:hypothetical protein
MDVIERARPIIIELERQRKPVMVVCHLAVMRCVHASRDAVIGHLVHIHSPQSTIRASIILASCLYTDSLSAHSILTCTSHHITLPKISLLFVVSLQDVFTGTSLELGWKTFPASNLSSIWSTNYHRGLLDARQKLLIYKMK